MEIARHALRNAGEPDPLMESTIFRVRSIAKNIKIKRMNSTSNAKIANLIQHDHWCGVEGGSSGGAFLLRFRTPVLGPPDLISYERLLTIVWIYADEGSGEMPTYEDSEQMKQFENRFCNAVEPDALAVLTAVLTLDGARQWVFYTRDIKECSNRLHEMPQNEERYPIELTTKLDPEWNYLRTEILARVPKEDWK
jgi:hypothetical protein